MKKNTSSSSSSSSSLKQHSNNKKNTKTPPTPLQKKQNKKAITWTLCVQFISITILRNCIWYSKVNTLEKIHVLENSSIFNHGRNWEGIGHFGRGLRRWLHIQVFFFNFEKSNHRLFIYCFPLYYHNASREQRFIFHDVWFKLAKVWRRLLNKEPVFRGELNR